MNFFKPFLLLFFIFFNNSLFANDLFQVIESLNQHLSKKGIKITEYRASVKDFEGYELITNITDNKLANINEPIEKIFLDKKFQNIILIYKEEKIDKNLKEAEEIELVYLYNILFKSKADFFYSSHPMYKKGHSLNFNNNYNIYHNSDRSFLINRDKTKIFSADILNYSNNELKFISKSIIENDVSKVRNLINKAYKENEYLTKIPDDMENLAVVFFSKQNKASFNAFYKKEDILKSKYGLLFLPYYSLEEDIKLHKDYQQFCQIDFFLNTELALISPNENFNCPDYNEQQIKQASDKLVRVYDIRNEILSNFHLSFDKPYFYLYKEMKLVDYDFFAN